MILAVSMPGTSSRSSSDLKPRAPCGSAEAPQPRSAGETDGSPSEWLGLVHVDRREFFSGVVLRQVTQNCLQLLVGRLDAQHDHFLERRAPSGPVLPWRYGLREFRGSPGRVSLFRLSRDRPATPPERAAPAVSEAIVTPAVQFRGLLILHRDTERVQRAVGRRQKYMPRAGRKRVPAGFRFDRRPAVPQGLP